MNNLGLGLGSQGNQTEFDFKRKSNFEDSMEVSNKAGVQLLQQKQRNSLRKRVAEEIV